MKKVIGFFLAVATVAGLAAFCTMRWTESRAATVNDVAAHAWLHQELKLTEEQHKAFEPVEAKFTETQRHLAEQLRSANQELARVMLASVSSRAGLATLQSRPVWTRCPHACNGEKSRRFHDQ